MSEQIKNLLSQAVQFQRAGKLGEAENLYNSILTQLPQQSDALHLLGLIRRAQGRNIEGLKLLDQALAVNKSNPEIHYNKGIILATLKRHDEALLSYDKAIALKPDYAEAFNGQGNSLQSLGHFEKALVKHDRAIAINPNFVHALNNRGCALLEMKRFTEALPSFDEVIVLAPSYAEAFNNRGNCWKALKRFEEALLNYDRAVELKPQFPFAWNNRGSTLQELERFDDALASYNEAIRLESRISEAFHNRGTTLLSLERFEEALSDFDAATKLNPNNADSFNGRGIALHKLQRFDDALSSYDKAIILKPHFAEAFRNRGHTLSNEGRLEDAKIEYYKALHIEPDHPNTKRNLAFTHLSLGEFPQGWQLYDSRFVVEYGPNDEHVREFIPNFIEKWDQDLNYKGELILFQNSREGGQGEVFQFIRYVPILVAMGMKVSLQTYGSLASFLSKMQDIGCIYPNNHSFEKKDYRWYPLKALPKVFKTTVDTIPAIVPYLFASQNVIDFWQSKVPKTEKFRIGIAWQGSLQAKSRSCDLSEFEPIAHLPNVELISLHKDFQIGHLNSCKFADKFIRSQLDLSHVMDWEHTAALMMTCDLIISIETAAAHLAGALGRPTWVVLEKTPSWRWMLDRSDSPWYPTLRLFRQRQTGVWMDVFKEIKIELGKLNLGK